MLKKKKNENLNTPHFITLMLHSCDNLFVRSVYIVIKKSLNFSIKSKKLVVHVCAYMTSHAHLIGSLQENKTTRVSKCQIGLPRITMGRQWLVLTKTFRNKVVLSFIFLLNFGCSSIYQLQESNLFLNGNNLIFNKNLNIDFSIAGDYLPVKKNSNKKLNEAIKSINSMSKSINLKKSNLLYMGESDDPNHLMFLFADEKNESSAKDTIHIFNERAIDKKIIYRKALSDKNYFIYMKYSNINSFEALKQDISNISKSIRIHDSLSYHLSTIFSQNQNRNILYQIKLMDEYPYSKNEQNKWLKFQFLTTLYSFDTKSDNYKSNVGLFKNKTSKNILSKKESISKSRLNEIAIANTLNATIEKISYLASKTNVLMLNENHFFPNHRIFGQLLLDSLKSRGYKYLALEAIHDTLINQRKFPIKVSGLYTKEPFFANFIREALRKDFKIIGYDSRGKDRELRQAQNIYEIIKNDKNEKIFVYAGFSHINEKTQRLKRMAEYFKEISSIDPITINQTLFMEDNIDETILLDSTTVKKHFQIDPKVDYFLINSVNTSFNSLYPKDELKKFSVSISKKDLNINFNLVQNKYFFVLKTIDDKIIRMGFLQ